MTAVFNALVRILQVLCVALFASLVVVVVLQVFTRQILQSPLTWTTPTAQYLFVWLALAGAALLFGLKEHIAVDFLMNVIGLHRSRSLEIGIHTLAFLFSAAVLVFGGTRGVFLTWSQNISGFPLSFGMVFLMLPVAGLITCFFSFYHIVEANHGRGLPDDHPDDIPEVA